MDEDEDAQVRARRAYGAQDWSAAADAFGAVAPHRLTADDLAQYADAVWWLGRIEDSEVTEVIDTVTNDVGQGCGRVGAAR